MRKTKQIRHAAKAIVIQAPSIDTVFTSRVMNLDVNQVPLVMVYFDEGSTGLKGMDSRETDAGLFVEIVAKATVDLDDVLDDLAEEVENLLDESGKLNGLVKVLSQTGFGYNRDDNSPLGTITLNYRVNF
jgi:hypothetical protein